MACLRFIPARAGNTYDSSYLRKVEAVHPRARGEHVKSFVASSCSSGSSPRARGTREVLRGELVLERFIPARAGNTLARARSAPQSPVHPRARGEHRNRVTDLPVLNGSSPRARGTQNHRSPCRR